MSCRRRRSRLSVLLAMALLMRSGCGLLTAFSRSRAILTRCSSQLELDDAFLTEVVNANARNISSIMGASTSDEWRTVDWKKQKLESNTPPPSPVDVLLVRDRLVYLKRDDQMRLQGSQISGNKARKMLALNQLPDDLFPSCVVSYGGPQSNAMLALAAVIHFRNQTDDNTSRTNRFVYYTKKLPRFLRQQPSGNLFRALSLGMELVEVSADEYKQLFGSECGGRSIAPPSLPPPVPGDSLFVPQGGACPMAEAGVRILAQEIVAFWEIEGKGRPLSVCVPGGTCSTGLLLHGYIQQLCSESSLDIEVVVIPCVGDAAYARRQMMGLNGNDDVDNLPTILLPSPELEFSGRSNNGPKNNAYFTFGEPDSAILDTFRRLRDEHEVLLDLLYGAPAWTVMLRHWQSKGKNGALFDRKAPLAGRETMYVHTGGLEGINSQLLRYKYKGLISVEDIQLPGRSKEKS